MNTGRLVARVVIGGLFVGHGMQKLRGDFDGPGIDGTAKMMDKIGMRPGVPNAYAAGVTEAAGGAMLVAGAWTPLSAGALIGTMITAIRTVHGPNGPWVQNRGYEYNVVLIAALMAIVDGGPGPLSVDKLRRHGSRGFLAMLGSLGLGAAASTIVVELGRSHASKQIDLTGYEPKHAYAATTA